MKLLRRYDPALRRVATFASSSPLSQSSHFVLGVRPPCGDSPLLKNGSQHDDGVTRRMRERSGLVAQKFSDRIIRSFECSLSAAVTSHNLVAGIVVGETCESGRR